MGDRSLESRSYLLTNEGLDHVAGFDVLVALESNATVESCSHLRDIVLEPAQRSDRAFVYHHIVAQQSDGRVAGNDTFDHVTAGDGSDLWHTEDLSDFDSSLGDFLELRLEESRHRLADLVADLLDDGVEAYIDFLFLCQTQVPGQLVFYFG